MLKLEQEGIPAVLDEHGFTWDDLGLRGATLIYRRRIEDMPLAEMPDDADDTRRQKIETTRRRILDKAMQKYLFSVVPLRLAGRGDHRGRPAGRPAPPADASRGRTGGADRRRVRGRARAARRELDRQHPGADRGRGAGRPSLSLGRPGPRPAGRLRSVFSTGNVVTGKGNIVASRKHSVRVTSHVIESLSSAWATAGTRARRRCSPRPRARRTPRRTS